MAEFKSQVLKFKKDSPFKVFKRIFAHDGCSMGLHKGLKNAFPGRFSETSPAAIELHCTMDLLNDSPDTHAERQYMPDWTDQSSVLGLLDCGYFDTQQMDQWSASNVHYIVRASISINPEIVACSSNPKLVGKKLKDAYSKFKQRQPTDLQVRWKGCEHNVRLIVRWNRDQKQFESLATNLQEDQFSADDVRQGYRLRWQIELLFKEWKSLTNLKKINTRNPEIAEGLIWASLIGALLRRIMAYQSEQVVDRVLSTWQASKLGTSQITEYWRWFVRKYTDRAKECWDQLMWLWGEEAGRQNKKRDNKKGRCNSGLVMTPTLNV
ncbi:IS4 family transposase [Pelagibaculum spongiae]|uniref:IS4 family transposase n=1 Tax=Pelagibaculum spongiae TaxID=2080658 RepID=UPI0013145FCA|nr:IS4 family transposase [Pelagibaculum spongiae]